MKLLLSIFFLLTASISFADSTPVEKIKFKKIKQYVDELDKNFTCMDEYLQRRNQLILKLSLSPVSITAGTAASLFVGAGAGAATSHLVGATGIWDELGYAIGGGLLGAAGGAIASGVGTTKTAINLRSANLVVKTLAEQYMGRDGYYSQRLYEKYSKKSRPISKEEFLARLIAADANGSLCDGSMVKQPRIKLGSSLKYKVAKIKDLAREL